MGPRKIVRFRQRKLLQQKSITVEGTHIVNAEYADCSYQPSNEVIREIEDLLRGFISPKETPSGNAAGLLRKKYELRIINRNRAQEKNIVEPPKEFTPTNIVEDTPPSQRDGPIRASD